MSERTCTRIIRQRAARPDPALDEWMPWLPCEHCGHYTNRPERHHRQFRSRGGLWVPSNVVLLCQKCHIDTTDERLPESGLNVGATEDPALVPVVLWWVDEPVLLDDVGTFALAG